ncbi:TIGR04255 family protein [Gemmata sp. G18]|uniref:TIGR04255 family protein n=1 Tax=Gemmata palustris TaxID=2822762 RepID=A0ABS5BRK5_9BACT|nr:TIGR04255 family protein [Gemmata palustris]MBP3956364.1 TIGR04255 family protein [Gemmata palustris]
MKLNKPPIVEMWVEFLFDPNPSESVEPKFEFLGQFTNQYPKLEILHEDTLEFQQFSPKQLPKVVGRKVEIRHLRASDEKATRWIHVTHNRLVCNFLRLGEGYPGFRALSEDAIAKLKSYVERCQPLKIRQAAIHYVDVIEIPLPENRAIQLADYFTLGLDLPVDPFGDQLSYLLRTAVRPADGTGALEIQLQSESLAPDGKRLRFRMDWHKSCPYDGEIDPDRILADLKRAHESIIRCFRSAFTETTWKLFDPED